MSRFNKSKWLGPCYKSKYNNEISDFQYLVSGTVEKGETMEDAVIREVDEEIGLKCISLNIIQKLIIVLYILLMFKYYYNFFYFYY